MAVAIKELTFVSGFCLLTWVVLRKLLRGSTLDSIPGPKAESWWAGHLGQLFSFDAWDFHQTIVEEYGGIVKLNSFFGGKALYISDPLALHHVVVKQQHIFDKHPADYAIFNLMFGQGLLSTAGDPHRKQRKMLNPVFSTAHLRHMVPTFHGIAKQLRKIIAENVVHGPQDIDMMHWLTHTALELVGQAGLGVQFDLLHEGATSPYADAIKCLGPVCFEHPVLLLLAPLMVKIGTPGFRRFVVEHAPFTVVQRMKEIADIMEQTSVDVYHSRLAALEKDGGADDSFEDKSILSILVKANMKASLEDRLSEAEVIGQLTTLMFAAMDTTSSALGRILHLLAQNPTVQDRLRQELNEAVRDSDLSYDELDGLPFLDAICRETSRFYCTVPFTGRSAMEDTILPLSSPIKDVNGREMKEVFVPEGTRIYTGIMAANRSKEIWGDDADQWKPERWLEPLPESVRGAHLPGVYSNMMTFLGGSRACIGFKFAELEMKVVLANLVNAFRFTLSEKEAFWRMGLIVTPGVKGSRKPEPQLFLRVESIDSHVEDCPLS
ncbi:cytochrome P450 [Heliocybe sulcata]|uniref:Cytochrome P450 n=1 Tax=Heliocybe sulcata TaxID=5364 RepID=A0A5C3MTN3_9AGAM|nr:cytochrome P450 [Heliocybe sulcata]